MSVSEKIMASSSTVSALLLAGSRKSEDPVARLRNVSNKVLAEIGGKPMILRVLDTLDQVKTIKEKILCGPDSETLNRHSFLQSLVDAQSIHWVPPQEGPSRSVGVVLERFEDHYPLLVTTADHALLTPEMVEFFINEAKREEIDVAVGLVPYPVVTTAYPHATRTVLRFKGKGFCGSNLFVLFGANARRLVQFWSEVEQERKRPIRLIRRLGVWSLFRYLSGRLMLEEAFEQLGRRLQLRIKPILLPFPEAAIDVDTPQDVDLVEHILAQREMK